jgi:hypothetical protein
MYRLQKQLVRGLCGLGCLCVCGVVSPAMGDMIQLSINATMTTATSGVWEVTGQYTDTSGPSGKTVAGLAAFGFDVIGSGGATVTMSQNDAPAFDSLRGFGFYRQDYDLFYGPGIDIHAAQNTFGGAGTNVYEGVGITPGFDSVSGTPIWAAPVVLGTGTFSVPAGMGTLAIVSQPEWFNSLLGPGGVWDGISIEAPSSIGVSAVTLPEPSSAISLLLAVGLLAISRWHRRAASH